MRWFVKMALAITGIIPLAKCGSGYRDDNGKVTFNGEEIKDKSFVVLNEVFAKSDSGAYYKRYGLSDVDIATFTALNRNYAKDKTTVFYCEEEREGQNYYLTKHSVITRIKGAIPASFSIIGNEFSDYAKDEKRAYVKGIGFPVKDVASLTISSEQFLKDKYQIYFEMSPVKNADPKSFRVLNNNYARDTSRVFYYGYHSDLHNGIHEIPCDAASFTILHYPYSKDANGVFHLYTKINEADPATFSILGKFSKDKQHVYYGTTILAGADPVSFTTFAEDSTLDDIRYTKDKSRVYWIDKPFIVADIAAFRPLALDYATDGKHIYYATKLVKGADPATFKVYDHGYGEADAEDARSQFLKGSKLLQEAN